MTEAFLDTQAELETPPVPVELHPPRNYRERTTAAYADAALLLDAILPEARIEHVGATAVPGLYSRGEVDVCVIVARERLHEALAVLDEAGFTRRDGHEAPSLLDAPAAGVLVRLVEAGSRHEACVRLRDALRDDASLVARSNALRIATAPHGEHAYEQAKAGFIREVLRG